MPPPPPPIVDLPPPPPVHHVNPTPSKASYSPPQPPQQYSQAVHHTNHAATPSRQGDIKQYERQSVVHPSPRGGGGGGGGDSRCAKCGNTLYGTEYVTAAGKAYHKEHFTCARCGTHLLGAYYDHHSQTYCPNCAGELMPCTKCHRGISGQYMILEGKPYHTDCVDRKHCAKCNRAIEDTVLTALGKSWHTRCFTCTNCGKELGTQFIPKDGHAQCENCSNRGRPNCDKCRNPLSGEYITFQGQSFHQDCFVCHQCKSRLGTAGFFNVGGNLKCSRCANR